VKQATQKKEKGLLRVSVPHVARSITTGFNRLVKGTERLATSSPLTPIVRYQNEPQTSFTVFRQAKIRQTKILFSVNVRDHSLHQVELE
jgi:hypothetical protein